MRKIALLMCFVLVGLTACKSAPGAKDSGAIDSIPLPKRAKQLPVPPETVMLVRVEPDATRDAIRRGLAIADGPSSRANMLTGSTILTSLIEGPYELEGAMTGRKDSVEKHFEGIDDTRPIYVAMSIAPSAERMRLLRQGVPPSTFEDLPADALIRVMLPPADEEALTSSIDTYCQDKGESVCRTISEVSNQAGWVTVDIVQGTAGRWREGDLPTYGTDEDAFDRVTPALHHFWTTEDAFAAYWTAESPVEMGAMTGSIEIIQALEHVSPDNRNQLFDKGSSLVMSQLLEESPNVREAEDAAMSLGSTKDGDLTFDTTQTLTQHGAKLVANMPQSPELPAIEMDSPMFELEMTGPGEKGLSNVDAPRWMQGDKRQVFETLRNSGLWGYMVPMNNYPVAFTRALSEMVASSRRAKMVQPLVDALAESSAIRIKMNVLPPSGQGRMPRPKVRGAITLVVPKDTSIPFDRWTGQAGQMLGTDIEVTDRVANDSRIYRISIGVGQDVFGAQMTQVETRGVARLAKVASEWKSGSVSSRDAQMLAMLEEAGTVSMALQTAAHQRAGRMVVGGTIAETPSAETGKQALELRNPEPLSECAYQLRAKTADWLGFLSDAEPENRRKIGQMVAQLDELNCPDRDRETKGLVRAGWRMKVAQQHEQRFNFTAAAEEYDAACEAGLERACEASKQISDRAGKLNLPAVALAHPSVGEVNEFNELSRSGLFIGGSRVADLQELESPRENLALKLQDQWQLIVDPTVDRTRRTAALVVDSSIPTGVVEWVESTIHTMQVPDRVLREAKVLGKELGEREVSSTLYVVRMRDQEGANSTRLLSTGDEAAVPNDEDLGLEVRVTAEGFQISSPRAELPPEKGCRKSGPTICLRDGVESIGDPISTITEQRESNSEAAAETTSSVVSAYDYKSLYNQLKRIEKAFPDATTVTVVVDPEIPFGVTAEVISAAWLDRADDSYESREAFRDARPGRDGKKLFENVVLETPSD